MLFFFKNNDQHIKVFTMHFFFFLAISFFAVNAETILPQSQVRSENNCKTIMDLFIVLDSSGSIGTMAFEQAKDALVELVSQLQIGPKKVQVWVVNYGQTVEVPISFNNMPMSEFTKENLKRKIKEIQYMNGACTATGSALEETRQICDKRCRGLHEGVSRVALVLSDGNGNCGASVGIASSHLLHITKANVFAVGIGSYINNAELQTIATDKNYIIHVTNYENLITAINNITLKTCGIPAFVVTNVKVESEMSRDTFRYYQLDTTELLQKNRNNEGGFIEIIANVTIGRIDMYVSTTNSNPGPGSGRKIPWQGRAAQQYHIEHVEHDVPRLYFSFYGVEDNNEYDFVLNWLDDSGSLIG